MLENNDERNRLRRLSSGDPGYLISNQSELADRVGMDKNNMRKLLGPAKATTKTGPLTDRSAFLARIRHELGLTAPVSVPIRPDRVEAIKMLASLPDDQFGVFESELRRIKQAAPKR